MRGRRRSLRIPGVPDFANRVVAVTVHGGGDRLGNEYELYTVYVPVVSHEGEIVGAVVWYGTSSKAEFCPHYGSFSPCSPSCAYELVSPPAIPEKVMEAFGTTLSVDLTGHEPVPCLYHGGCAVCYPCQHLICMGGLNDDEQ